MMLIRTITGRLATGNQDPVAFISIIYLVDNTSTAVVKWSKNAPVSRRHGLESPTSQNAFLDVCWWLM